MQKKFQETGQITFKAAKIFHIEFSIGHRELIISPIDFYSNPHYFDSLLHFPQCMIPTRICLIFKLKYGSMSQSRKITTLACTFWHFRMLTSSNNNSAERRQRFLQNNLFLILAPKTKSKILFFFQIIIKL